MCTVLIVLLLTVLLRANAVLLHQSGLSLELVLRGVRSHVVLRCRDLAVRIPALVVRGLIVGHQLGMVGLGGAG